MLLKNSKNNENNALEKYLKTNILGRNFVYYENIDSTQTEALRIIEKDCAVNGTLILADIQTNGKRNTW